METLASANAAENLAAAQVPVTPAARRFNFATCSLWHPEPTLLKQLVVETSAFPGPIIEIGTLIGLTTTQMAVWDEGERKIITVDNYCWNPWGLCPEDQQALAEKILFYLTAKGRVQALVQDKNKFYRTYRGPAPSLVFLDAVHDYAETKKDIEWARSVGAKVISGHDYRADMYPEVIRAVEDAGGARRLVGSLWVL